MGRALILAVGQLTDPATRRVLWRAVGGALLLALLLIVGSWAGLAHLSVVGIPWLDTVIDVLGGVGSLFLAWLLFPGLVAIIVGLLLEEVTRAVERRHYPNLPPARGTTLAQDVALGVKVAGLSILVALVALASTLFLPGLNLVIFLVLNGYLFGVEYFDQISLRRLSNSETRLLRSRHISLIWLAGALVCALTLIPIVNLTTPIIATALMTHLFESLRRDAGLAQN